MIGLRMTTNVKRAKSWNEIRSAGSLAAPQPDRPAVTTVQSPPPEEPDSPDDLG
jgi:hypothetical protein